MKALMELVNFAYYSRDLNLTFKDFKEHTLKIYADASHISEGGYGMTGYIIFYNNNPIIWKSKKQRCVATSAAEAEIVSLCDALKEATWLRDTLMSMCLTEPNIAILEDNQAVIEIAKNAVISDKTRHIMPKTAFIREKLNDWNATIQYIPTDRQTADGFTKSLPFKAFTSMQNSIGLVAKGGMSESD